MLNKLTNKGERTMTNLNLTKEEKEIVITQLTGLIGFPATYHKYLKPIKNPNDFTKKMIVTATEAWIARAEEVLEQHEQKERA